MTSWMDKSKNPVFGICVRAHMCVWLFQFMVYVSQDTVIEDRNMSKAQVSDST